MDLRISTLAEHDGDTDLWDRLNGHWPAFMTNDPTGALYYAHTARDFPEFCPVAVDEATGEPVAKAHSVPFSHDTDVADGLPGDGWDWVIRRSAHDRLNGTAPTAVSALEILIRPDVRGTGHSARMLTALRDNTARLGFTDLVAPIRPSGKHLDPITPIDRYVEQRRADGLPADPWLRVHVRAGGRVLGVAHTSMVVSGRLERWREWTGLPFDVSGPVVVPDALVPVHCDVAQDVAVYVEPNVWVHHRL